MNTVFDYTVKDRKGNAVSLRSYANEVLLIVNTATKSPYTPQYTELEALYEKYHSQGFAVLDFPSNQPTKSCPGKDDMVHDYVKETYNTKWFISRDTYLRGGIQYSRVDGIVPVLFSETLYI